MRNREDHDRPVHVVHIIGSLGQGGAESVALELCRRMPTEVRQTFVCVSGRRGALADQFEHLGASVITYGEGGVLRTCWGLLRTLRSLRPDVVQAHVALTSAVFLLIARAHRVPRRIARIHSQGDGKTASLGRVAYRRLMRWLLRHSATRVLGVSSAACAFASGDSAVANVPIEVVPNGVDVARFRLPSGSEMRQNVVLHVGRADPAKNRALLPAIAQELQALGTTKMWVAGGGTDIDIPGEHPNLVLLGVSDDVPGLLRQVSCLLLPSVREGLPTVVLEALASGVPVVASAIAAHAELASSLPGVTMVALDEPPSAWAQTVLSSSSLSQEDREPLRAAVVDSVFNLDRNVDVWRKVWGCGAGAK